MGARNQLRPLDPGSLAPGFHLPYLGSGATSLADLISGGPVLLVFFKITCPVCQLTLPILERLHQAGSLKIVGISQNDAADTRDFNREFGVTFPVLLDSEDTFPASNAYGISSVPTSFLVETDGRISRLMEGWRKADIEDLGNLVGTAILRPGDNVPAWKAG